MITYFSVVIPTLNEEKYLPKLLRDLAEQSFSDFEVVVVDGKSDDGTVGAVKKFQNRLPKLTILDSKERNVSIQRNMGGKTASGEWIIFMDADDRIPNNFLEKIKSIVEAGDVDIFTCWGSADKSSASEKAITLLINLIMEVKQVGALGSMIGVRREVFRAGKDFNPNIGFGEDGEFVRSLVALGYVYEVFRNPKYTFSLRRVRKEGKLKAAGTYARLILKMIAKYPIDQKREYPMGGDYFEQKVGSGQFLLALDKKVRRIVSRPRLIKKIKSLLESNGFSS